MKKLLLIIISAALTGCYTPKITAVECDIVVKGNRIMYKNFGKQFPITDTIIRGFILTQKTLKH